MNKKVQKQWIKALLGGEYEQGKKSLHPKSKFCCLGVLCDIHRLETNGPNWCIWTGYLDNKYLLPYEVENWADILDSDLIALAQLNDTRNITFPEIAYVIKEL